MKNFTLKKWACIILFVMSASLLFVSILYAADSGGVESKIWCYNTVNSSAGEIHTHFTYCGSCAPVLAVSASDKNFCQSNPQQ